MRTQTSNTLNKTLTYVALILGSVVMIFPFVWMLLTSFKTQAESMAVPPQLLPSQWNLDNYVTALASLPFVNLYVNTAHRVPRAVRGDLQLHGRLRLRQAGFPL